MLSSRGFTIVEVIVALLVLAVGLTGTVSAFAAATRTFEYGHSSVLATVRAAELLESVRARGCGASASGSANENAGVFSWTTTEISADLRLVTVVFNPRTLRSRADTFSAILPC